MDPVRGESDRFGVNEKSTASLVMVPMLSQLWLLVGAKTPLREIGERETTGSSVSDPAGESSFRLAGPTKALGISSNPNLSRDIDVAGAVHRHAYRLHADPDASSWSPAASSVPLQDLGGNRAVDVAGAVHRDSVRKLSPAETTNVVTCCIERSTQRSRRLPMPTCPLIPEVDVTEAVHRHAVKV